MRARISPDRTERVLFVAPTRADARLTESLLSDAGLDALVCANTGELGARMTEGAGVVLLTDETLADASLPALVSAIQSQPMWSDVPVLLLSGAKTDPSVAAWAMESLGNVTVLERPVRVTTLVSALRSAIRARRRQYQLRDQLDELAATGISLRRQGERLRLLWEAASLLLASDDSDSMLHGVFETIAPHLALDVFLFFVLDDTGVLRLKSWAGIGDEEAQRLSCLEVDAAAGELGEGFPSLRAASGGARSPEPSLRELGDLGLRACASSPLVIDGRVLGTLSFGTRRRDAFTPDEVDFLHTLGDYVTLAYERLRLIRKLRETDRRKDEFLATLAHELRNPLAPIGNALEIMRIVERGTESADDARRMIERQLTQMVRLIDDLLDVSRITRGKLELRREIVELGPIVEQAVDIARPLIQAAGHELALELPPQPVLLHVDPVRLAQVLSNLLNNAAKYMDHGGRIALTAEVDGYSVRIAVRDEGVGIPASALHSIFDMFTQVDRSLEKSHGGLGIGLTLVKRLTEMHGGTVDARSEGPGRGSEFVVRLPLAAAATSVPTPDGEGIDDALRVRHRVLVADDNADAADSMGLMLRLMGNEVRTAQDGEQAVATAREFRPDLVLLDIGMPRMNGYDAARRIRETPWGKSMVLVAVTGWGQEQDKRRATESGFDRHFTKPLRRADLEALLGALPASGRARVPAA